ncbi:MAG: HypC/HybG/HupF family hydrogenase formation chaperone [Gammaproteobacteria bacterium]|nr:HypC/HybG/HupF family hydrogenase formation chaperone [Gammaproteobacteria bacterium]
MCLAVPGRIRSIQGDGLARSGRIAFGGITREVSLACVPDARVDDYVIVHAGIAIAHLDEAEARRSLDALGALEALAGAAPA